MVGGGSSPPLLTSILLVARPLNLLYYIGSWLLPHDSKLAFTPPFPLSARRGVDGGWPLPPSLPQSPPAVPTPSPALPPPPSLPPALPPTAPPPPSNGAPGGSNSSGGVVIDEGGAHGSPAENAAAGMQRAPLSVAVPLGVVGALIAVCAVGTFLFVRRYKMCAAWLKRGPSSFHAYTYSELYHTASNEAGSWAVFVMQSRQSRFRHTF